MQLPLLFEGLNSGCVAVHSHFKNSFSLHSEVKSMRVSDVLPELLQL